MAIIDDIFPGTSEMARNMRALDWSKTTLGPAEQWPQSLRTSVSTCLDCAFPIVIWWGPELTILYNDEYLQILGPSKHPSALGQPGAAVWAEIWDVIGPMLAHVIESAEPTRSRDLLLHIDRGYLEEAYFSFSYSPIHAEGGTVAGIFCPVIETTEKIIGERRLRMLRDLAAKCKGAESEASVYQAAADILRSNPHDIPFALIYQVEERHRSARLCSVAGVERGTKASPEEVILDEGPCDQWALGRVARTGEAQLVSNLRARVNGLPTGAWKIAADSAVVLPVLLPGQEQPRAILVAAVSPMRALDDDYRTFFGLVATQIASALADAQALAEERRRSEALAELDRAKTVFFSNVSHEFRTPLTLMIGPLQDLLATDDTQLTPETTETLTVAYRNGLRLLKLVNTLLDFSRIEAGRIDACYEPTDLALFTTELASVFRSAVEKAGLRFLVACPKLSEPVYVDRDMWEKIVLNLLSNAFKFTLDGEIRVTLQREGDTAELRVSDTGVGIAEAELPHMFERFHRIRRTRARTYEGTGIGLALVHELVRLHGGSVSVASAEGRGTTFAVTLPLGKAHLPLERIGPSRQLALTTIGASSFVEEALRWLPAGDLLGLPDGHTMLEIPDGEVDESRTARAQVLVADDNADMRDYLTRILSPLYDVDAVADGAEAWRHIEHHTPDLVLSDVMMPELDGFALLAAIRHHDRSRSIPVILLSARAGEEARIEGLDAGADEYLVKPFSARELIARVASQLQLTRLRRETEQQIAESERRLRDADRRKDEFLALLAHELRNPLAPVRTGLELIRLSNDSPEAVKRVRSMMERQVAQMVRLIDDLLDVSRITSGKIVLKRQPALLADVVQHAIDGQREVMRASQVELSVQLPDMPCVIDVDPARFAQVLSNVLHNASKFTPATGRIHLTAAIVNGTDSPDSELRLTVADTGVGISAELLPHIFELFTQAETPTERSHGGLGIGLALAQRLMELHGGRISAHSDGPGLGSSFTISLPLIEALTEIPATPPARAGRIRHRVVIIDDNSDAATTLSMLVEELGGSTRTANDALSGLRAVQEFRPDVVFLDVGMPGMNGYEVCRRIRRTASHRPMLVVAVTGWGQEQDKQRARDAGFDYHLTKPFDPAALTDLLISHQRTVSALHPDRVPLETHP
jgi:signal transduction histidine kinase